ncbi:MAG: mechanosensitive ion channel family protein, partial [Desulfobulbaceae bacterium]|nr:mechanosensitive ion channel family protein [Desulfobulbaceae bacterium]
VKVQNWDKTITSIPTYAMVSDSFKNWRGMAESGGRRIKRSIFIDMNSITFCTDEMLDRFSRYELIKEYLEEKKSEIEAYNQGKDTDTAVLVNGRRQTNVGVFRAYIKAYLRSHPEIHQNMTFLVRHLSPTSQGLPIEIYIFSRDTVWANYEGIQADIFDHILAVVPEFELRTFQYPSGVDLGRTLGV